MKYLPLLALVCLMAGPAFADGKTSFTVCTTCHGANGEGNQALNAPAIAGQEAWYLKRQLQNFKAGIRGTHAQDVYGAQMKPMAMTLADDKAIDEVVAYIGTLPKPAKPAATLSGGDAAAGKTGYAVCTSCHGAKGEGMEAMNAPRLTGLPDWYALRQLQNFKNKVRGADPKDTWGMTMAPMAATLADEKAMKDVLAYIQTLPN